MPITLLGLDADDTLWHNETFFRMTEARFRDLLAPYAPAEEVGARLAATEARNLSLYGYGAKGFALSMIETALDIAGDDLPAAVVRDILAAGRDMLRHPVEPLPGAREAVEALHGAVRLVLITKGDLFHQESKLAASGLGSLFDAVEIVADKRPDTYRRIFARHGVDPARAMMAGNSVRSDVLPVLDVGAWAALIPYHLVWSHEAAEVPRGNPRFRELASLADLPGWIAEIA